MDVVYSTFIKSVNILELPTSTYSEILTTSYECIRKQHEYEQNNMTLGWFWFFLK